jgi:ATP-binding cassette, subfamily C (CFTR/MRP), member 1
MSFGDILNYIIRWWTQMETSVGAIARLKSLGDKVPHEDNTYRENSDDNIDKTIDLIPPEWPAHGQIEIKDVSASYQ